MGGVATQTEVTDRRAARGIVHGLRARIVRIRVFGRHCTSVSSQRKSHGLQVLCWGWGKLESLGKDGCESAVGDEDTHSKQKRTVVGKKRPRGKRPRHGPGVNNVRCRHICGNDEQRAGIEGVGEAAWGMCVTNNAVAKTRTKTPPGRQKPQASHAQRTDPAKRTQTIGRSARRDSRVSTNANLVTTAVMHKSAIRAMA
jgi:hypothetical protein